MEPETQHGETQIQPEGLKKLGFEDILQELITIALGLIPTVGASAEPVIERMVTIPQGEIEAACSGMTDAQKAEAVAKFRVGSHALAVGVLFVASRGSIDMQAKG